MKRAYEFLKNAGTFYLATVEGDKPRVRPFGAVNVFEDKLYFITSTRRTFISRSPPISRWRSAPRLRTAGGSV